MPDELIRENESLREEIKRVRRECRAHHDTYTFLRASLEKIIVEAEVMRKEIIDLNSINTEPEKK